MYSKVVGHSSVKTSCNRLACADMYGQKQDWRGHYGHTLPFEGFLLNPLMNINFIFIFSEDSLTLKYVNIVPAHLLFTSKHWYTSLCQ